MLLIHVNNRNQFICLFLEYSARFCLGQLIVVIWNFNSGDAVCPLVAKVHNNNNTQCHNNAKVINRALLYSRHIHIFPF